MKKKITILLTAILLVVGVFFANVQTNSPTEKMTIVTSMEYPHYDSIDNLSDKASDIVMGKIVDVRVEQIDTLIKTDDTDEVLNPGGDVNDTPMIYTVFTLEINDVYKGNNSIGEFIEIKQLGGETDEFIHISESELSLGMVFDYVFFLQSYDAVPASILNPYQSVYIFDTRTRSLSKVLTSVNNSNDLTLTYGDLIRISDKN